MKIYKLSLILVAAAAVVFGLSGISFAFHSGGVAECTGCHQMHGAASSYLTVGVDDTSTCFTCHMEAGSSFAVATADSLMPAGTPPANLTPGGDFGWLHKSYYYSVRGSANTDLGDAHGHNVIAAGVTPPYTIDPVNTTAPGGTFPSSALACTSCHDEHGQGRWLPSATYSNAGGSIWTSGSYGSVPTVFSTGENLATGVYRLLRGALNSSGGSGTNSLTFGATPPVAVAPSSYSRSEQYTQTRVAYSNYMTDFCATCHPDMHTTAGILRHPSEQTMSGTVQGNYNSYVYSGNMTGSPTTSYLSLVPFEEGSGYSVAGIGTLATHAKTDNSNLNGPGSGTVPATAQVFCLSCHRAHATGFDYNFRWDSGATTITLAGAYPTGSNAQGKNLSEVQQAYYGYNVTTFSAYQRQLCNKCHAKD